MMRSFKVQSPTYFQMHANDIINYSHHAAYYIPMTYFITINDTFYNLYPGNHQSTLSLTIDQFSFSRIVYGGLSFNVLNTLSRSCSYYHHHPLFTDEKSRTYYIKKKNRHSSSIFLPVFLCPISGTIQYFTGLLNCPNQTVCFLPLKMS